MICKWIFENVSSSTFINFIIKVFLNNSGSACTQIQNEILFAHARKHSHHHSHNGHEAERSTIFDAVAHCVL